MRLTDQDAIKALKKARLGSVETMLSDYPEDDRDGRTDWEMIASEAEWLLYLYNTRESSRHESLVESKEILRLTKYGKSVPVRLATHRPLYSSSDIQAAKEIVNEYHRLERFVEKLKKQRLS